MRSSGFVGIRAFALLACTVGVPLLAISNASWPGIAKKFQNLHWPSISDFALASSETPNADTATASASASPSTLPKPLLPAQVDVPKIPLMGNEPLTIDGKDAASGKFREIQDRLRSLGATYYILESYIMVDHGREEPIYRFFCKVAVGKSPDYVHCFEAIDAEPVSAMRKVLEQVESWRQSIGNVAER
jgi:hypothetical protein